MPQSICHPNPGIESLPPPVPAKSCWWDLECRDFPWWGTMHRSTCPVAALCHWLFPVSSGFNEGYPGQAVLSLWLKPFFEALWGDFGNDSTLCSPLQGMDVEKLMSQAWLKDSSFLTRGLVHPLPGDNPDSLLLSPCSLSPQLDGLLSFCLLELHLELDIH